MRVTRAAEVLAAMTGVAVLSRWVNQMLSFQKPTKSALEATEHSLPSTSNSRAVTRHWRKFGARWRKLRPRWGGFSSQSYFCSNNSTLKLIWKSCLNAAPRFLNFVAESEGEVVGYIIWVQKSGFRPEAVLETESNLPCYQAQGRDCSRPALILNPAAGKQHLARIKARRSNTC